MRRPLARLLCFATASSAILGLPALTWAQQQKPMYGPHVWNGAWSGWFFGPIMMIFFLVVAVAVIVLVVRWLGGAEHGSTAQHAPCGKTPLDILKERFAKGEIDKEEFEERRRVLGE